MLGHRRTSPTIRRCCTALNPDYAVRFLLIGIGAVALVTMGAVLLAVTGAEALYADLGHFGRKPIQLAWFGYRVAGAAAELFRPGRAGACRIRRPIENPFYRAGAGLGCC